jgi:pyruvate dehydrogenase E2 component (dihydrolipoamide acetyltransferase)
MPTDFTLPELGENVTAGDVVRVLVSSGDAITKDQPVLELETDKATIEVPSSVSGTVREIRVKAGERVKVGQTVLIVDEGGAAKKAPAEAVRAGAPKPPSAPAPEEGGLSQAAPGSVAPQPPSSDHAEESAGRQKRRQAGAAGTGRCRGGERGTGGPGSTLRAPARARARG